MGLFKKKKPEEADAEVQMEDYDKPAKKETKQEETVAVPPQFLGAFALYQQICDLEMKVSKLLEKADELLKLAKD